MKRYPLQQLLQLRAHRAAQARERVLACRREVDRQQAVCDGIGREIDELDGARRAHKARLLETPPAGVPWPVALSQREAHIDWLATKAQEARVRLASAQEVLRQAEHALQDAREAYLRAQAREDALHKRKDVWRGEQRALEARQEEAAAAELPPGGRRARAPLH